jgi:Fe-Mn family superoxide dismutase
MMKGLMAVNNHYPFELVPLPYAYDALEPYIDAETMALHHDKHLRTYVDNLNTVLSSCPPLQDMTLEELVACSDRLPDQIREKVKNNAGGVYNHNLYFSLMSPASKLSQSGNLYDAIIRCFGSFDEFKNVCLLRHWHGSVPATHGLQPLPTAG